MRVQGNISPAILAMESYFPDPGYVEVRLRENIKEVTSTDPVTKGTFTAFEYDEYTFIVKDRVGLQEDIESHLNEWIATGRTLEVNESASIVQDMKAGLEQLENLSAQNAEYEAALSEIEAALEVT